MKCHLLAECEGHGVGLGTMVHLATHAASVGSGPEVNGGVPWTTWWQVLTEPNVYVHTDGTESVNSPENCICTLQAELIDQRLGSLPGL